MDRSVGTHIYNYKYIIEKRMLLLRGLLFLEEEEGGRQELGRERVLGGETYGMKISSCSSLSLTSSGSGSRRCGHVFSTILAPASTSLSFNVRIFSNSICFQMRL